MKDRAFIYPARILLVLFFIANAGFTRIVQTCSMDDMGCCGSTHSEMQCPSNSPIPGETALTANADCMTHATLGGHANTRAIEVNSLKIAKLQTVGSLPMLLLHIPNLTTNKSSVAISLAHNLLCPIPSSPKYVLNLSLLI